ncbi:MAG: hypothetical protein K2I30_03990 [Clostridia bacterium]|nr:hypothetical protein [Clostridia bacterium]
MANSERQKEMSKIVGLLNYGTFWGESRKKILISYLIVIVLCISLMILSIVMLSIEQTHNPDSIVVFVVSLTAFVLAFSVLPITLTILIIKNEKVRKEVSLWIEDSVKVGAFAKSVGIKKQLGIFPCVKIQIDFDINGVHYSRESHSNHYKDKSFEDGYYYIWSKYCDRKIDILYSPKYDEVMILKD